MEFKEIDVLAQLFKDLESIIQRSDALTQEEMIGARLFRGPDEPIQPDEVVIGELPEWLVHIKRLIDRLFGRRALYVCGRGIFEDFEESKHEDSVSELWDKIGDASTDFLGREVLRIAAKDEKERGTKYSAVAIRNGNILVGTETPECSTHQGISTMFQFRISGNQDVN